jgi:RNA polymerase sigma-70 factor (ECF subfamily)
MGSLFSCHVRDKILPWWRLDGENAPMVDEQDNWQGWFGRHGPAMVLFARQFVPSRADAEDAVQDGFVRFWRSRARADDPKAYLYACIRSASKDLDRARDRRQHREQLVGDERLPAYFTCPLEMEERRQHVERAMASLPAEQRQVLILKIWAGLTFSQIGWLCEIPINTAASRYRYALETLREQLPEEDRT